MEIKYNTNIEDVELENEAKIFVEKIEYIEIRRRKRQRKAKTFGDDFTTILVEYEPLAYLTDNDSLTYNDAVRSPDEPFWREAIQSELDSIVKNHTQELVELLLELNQLGANKFLRKNKKTDGTINKFKISFLKL